jgi:hypothetical protein
MMHERIKEERMEKTFGMNGMVLSSEAKPCRDVCIFVSS